MFTSHSTRFCSWILLLLLASCSGRQPEAKEGRWEIRNLSELPLTTISAHDNLITIETIGLTVYGQSNGSTRLYYGNGKEPLYKVEWHEKSLKLFSGDQLRWQLNLKDQELTLSNNPEGTGANRINLVERNISLFEGDRLIRESVLNPEAYTNVSGYQVMGLSIANGILLIRNIDDLERYILMAELYAAGY